MIRELSSGVGKWLEREGAIPDEDINIFSYAAYSLLLGLLPILIILLLGLAFGMVKEGLLLIAPFMTIRKFSGGYHLSSLRRCIILSSSLLTLSMGLVKVITYRECGILLTVFVFLSVLCLCVFSPIENNARKLTAKEKKLFHIIACILAVIAMITYLIMYKSSNIQYASAFGVGIILVATLQIPCAIILAEQHHPSQ